MGSRGWVKLHRKIQDHWIYQEDRIFSKYEAWLDLIMLANHKDNKVLIDGELETVKKGSFITSKRKLCIRWKWSNTKVDNFLKLLEQDEMIQHKSDTKKTVISIVKYEVYHELEKEKRHESDTETTRERRESDTETYKQELKNLRTKELKKDISTTIENDAIVFYQNNIGMIRPNIAEEMLNFINDFGDEMVIEALRRSLDRNKPSWGYAKSILMSWSNKGIKTMDQAKAEEIEFQNQQASRFTSFKNTNKDITPDWFNNRKPKEDKQPAELVGNIDEILNQFKQKGAASND